HSRCIRKGVWESVWMTVENRMFSPERHMDVLERVLRTGADAPFERMQWKRFSYSKKRPD
ncbi:MAG: hypothetical protein ACI9R7_001591, partial [Lysobacterales bacterium]